MKNLSTTSSHINPFNRLFWQVAAVFLTVLLIFGAISLYISLHSARSYSEEVNQKLHRDLAKNVLQEIGPLFVADSVNQKAVGEIMHSMMVINPTLEIYLTNEHGEIISFFAPKEVVKLEKIDLDPVIQFLESSENLIIYGDDPRNHEEEKIFSASKIIHNDDLTGYLYIVLASQEYTSAAQMVESSYILGWSIKAIVSILVITGFAGLVAIWFLTKKLNTITQGINSFRAGNYKTRIPVQHQSELDIISLTFNEMAQTIEKNIEELKGLDNLRRELISNISHDLRTPIASIQGYAETLQLKADKISPEEQRKYLDIIVKSSEKLKKQVAELFELSKLEAKQVKPSMESFGIAELIQDVISKFHPLAKERNIHLHSVLSKNLPLVHADISLIERAIQNLLDNALKFSEAGSTVTIAVDLDHDQKVKVSIADTGCGIPQKNIPFIFQRYYKSNDKAVEESTGLGLAIVKKIVELHQSEIVVQSHLGKGTEFSFFLPIAAAS